MRRPRIPLVALLLVAACAAIEEDPADSVEWLIAHGRYEAAVARAAEIAEANPKSESAARIHREATLALLLERGRRLTFADRDVEALAQFDEALELCPERPEPVMWIQKTRNKLAEHYLEMGLELHASDQLEQAIDAYESSLKYDPKNRSALTGMAEATFAINYRAGLGRQYYEDGLHSLYGGGLEQARGDFGKSSKYQQSAQLDQRKAQVAGEIALSRIAVAEGLEAEGKWDAARNEYRFALALDPENARAKAGKDAAAVEAHAAQKYRDAQMELVRGRIEKAVVLAEEGARITQRQKELFEGLQNQVQEAKLERHYRTALSFERDGKFPEAVAEYEELLKAAAYYKDVLTRKETLEDFIERADRLYAQAQAETDPQKRIEILKQILQFWPDYRDVSDTVRELTKAQQPQQPQ
jgi:tetratricopeptide (TPR) repeat protein